MNLDDAKVLWQDHDPRPPTPTDDPMDAALPLDDLRRRAAAFDRTIFWRDAREVAAAVLVAAGFAWALTVPAWTVRLGGVLGIASCALVVYRLLAARRRHPDPPADAPLVPTLRAELARLDAQIELLRSVWRWYVAPLLASAYVTLMGWTAHQAALDPSPLHAEPLFWVFYATTAAALLVGAGWAIHRLNQKAVDDDLTPRRAELAALLEEREGYR